MNARSVMLISCISLITLQPTARADNETMDPRGKPKQFEAGKGAMFALWFEKGEWHLRNLAAKEAEQGTADHRHGLRLGRRRQGPRRLQGAGEEQGRSQGGLHHAARQ